MVDKLQVENPSNASMHYGNAPVFPGAVPAPNSVPAPNIYSGAESIKIYNQMQMDLYESQKKQKPKKKGLPKILKILGGAFATYLLYAVAKPSVVKAFNKIFRRG